MSIPLYIWLLLFTIIPLLMILFYAFVRVDDGGMHITLSNIISVTQDKNYISSFLRSVYYAALSTVVCLLLGYPLAYIMTRLTAKFRNLVVILLMLPMWMNIIIRTYALMALIEENSILSGFFKFIGIKSGALIGTTTAIIIGMVYNFLPFLVLPIYTSLLKIDNGIIEAAQDLGGNAFTVFRKVMFPLTLPAVLSGITMVFVPSVTTFIIPQLLYNKNWTIGRLIEYKFLNENTAGATVSGDGSALSLLLMIIIIIVMSLVNKVDKDSETGGVI